MEHHFSVRIAIVLGSIRENSMTGRVAEHAINALRSNPSVEVDVIDPARLDLPLPGQDRTPDALFVQELIEQADGVILASPEYHGSFSSVMKLVIDNLGFPSHLKGKPVSLLGVAAGRIGAIKSLEHLRSVASHVGAIVLPGPVSVANVRSAFDSDGQFTDPGTEKMVRSLADDLVTYIRTSTCPRAALEHFVRQHTVN